jgi:uncharacterized small protein (DUF1192 family)
MATKKKSPAVTAANGEPAAASGARGSKPARMTTAHLERRVNALEAEVTRLKAAIEAKSGPQELGWRRIIGSFADDPAFDEAMRLGREWRESFDRRRRSRRARSSDDRP